MANMDVTIPHQLSKEDALKRIQNLMAETKNEYGDKITNLKETGKVIQAVLVSAQWASTYLENCW